MNIFSEIVNTFVVFSYPDVIIKDGERWGTYRGFIKPILHRKKLTISLFSDVIKIHLNYETKPRAFGVTYQKNGVDYFVSVKKEIIVSAGVIESPKLLLLSGIGPKNHLESVQIKPLIDLPVGMTYISQPYVALKFQINESISIIVNRDLNDNAFLNYYTHRNGPLATPLARFGIGYSQGIKTANQKYRTYYYIFNGLGGDASSEHELFSKDSDLKPGIYEKFYKPQADKDGFFVEIECVRVKSSGTIRLATKNPKDRPLIDPNYFSNLNDMDCLIDGIVYMVDLIESGSPMQKIDAHVPPIAFPGCETLEFKSRSYWECYIRQLTGSPDAGRSTCRMGDGSKLSEKTAVIDPEFCVLGVKGLRVIDASSIPTVATSNLMAITIMLGEIGSELILDKWEKGVKIESKTNSSTIIY